MCHDLDQRSFRQGQGYYQKKNVWSISSLWRNIGSCNSIQKLLMTRGWYWLKVIRAWSRSPTGKKAKLLFGPYYSCGDILEVVISHKCCLWLYPSSFGQGQGHWQKVQNSCPLYIFLMEKHWKFLIYRKIAYDLRVSHNLDQWSFGQVKSHWLKEILNFCLRLSCVIGR